MIKTWHWIELMINGSSEPTVADTLLSSSLLNELNIVWQDHDWLNHEDTKDEIIVRLCQWRKLKHQQCLKERLHTLLQLDSDVDSEKTIQKTRSLIISRQKNSSLNNVLASVMVSEETHQFWRKFIQRRTSSVQTEFNMTEDQVIWWDKLQSRTRTKSQRSRCDRQSTHLVFLIALFLNNTARKKQNRER